MNGGVIDDEYEELPDKNPTAIELCLNMVVTNPQEPVKLSALPSSMDNFYLFYNGKMLYPGKDYEVSPQSCEILLSAAEFAYGDKIYAFENVHEGVKGCMRNIERKLVEETTKRIYIEGLDPSSKLLAFYDGDLLFPDSYAALHGSVKFVSSIEAGKMIDITECLFSPDSTFEMVYSGSSDVASSYLKVDGVNPEIPYLVFYDGKLMMESLDYKLQKNVIVFLNELVLDVNKKIVVLRI